MRERPEFVLVLAAMLDESLRFARSPVPSLALPPAFIADDYFVAVSRVRREPVDPAEVRRVGGRGTCQRARHVVDVDASGPVGSRPGPDALLARRVNVLQVAVVHQLPVRACPRFEVEGAPGD